MQTGMRGKRSPSRRVFVCYCDITSLEEQLQMVSTVTEQSDTSPLIHSDSWIRPIAARERSSAKETLQIELALQPRLVKEHLSLLVCVSSTKKFKLSTKDRYITSDNSYHWPALSTPPWDLSLSRTLHCLMIMTGFKDNYANQTWAGLWKLQMLLFRDFS